MRSKRKGPGYLEEDYRTIGVMSTGRGAGATHFTILLANYLAGVERKKTAVLEWNGHGDLGRMEEICTGREGQKPYRVLEVWYYKDSGMDDLVSCINKNYDRIIIDFGDSYGKNRTEFMRCDKKIVLMALSEWQIGGCLEFAEQIRRERTKSWQFYVSFGSEESRIEVKRKLGLPVRRVPFSADAFLIDGGIITFFQQL